MREELGVLSLSEFNRFLRLCALGCGELLNVSALASDCGVSVKTVRKWRSILAASHIVYLLQPYFSNTRKCLIKSPKLYFVDTGLACSLLGIERTSDLATSEHWGHLFEAAVIGEVLKLAYACERAAACLAGTLVGEVPAVAVGAAVDVEGGGAVALAGVDGGLGFGARGVARL